MKTIEELRKGFEEMSHIKIYKNEIKFDDGESSYIGSDNEIECYVNGAWETYKELNK